MKYEVNSTGITIYDDGDGGKIPVVYIFRGEHIEKRYKMVLTHSKKVINGKMVDNRGVCIQKED